MAKKDMKAQLKLSLGWIIYGILYPISGIMLLILLYDVYTGKAYIKNGSTLPAKSYIIVLVASVHIMYRQFRHILVALHNKNSTVLKK